MFIVGQGGSDVAPSHHNNILTPLAVKNGFHFPDQFIHKIATPLIPVNPVFRKILSYLFGRYPCLLSQGIGIHALHTQGLQAKQTPPVQKESAKAFPERTFCVFFHNKICQSD